MSSAPPPPSLVPADAVLIGQGAEGRVYEGTFCGRAVIVKERFPKSYRHPVLDEKLTKKRLVAEVRCLMRCRKAGIRAPAPVFVDEENSRIFLEKVSGDTARAFLTRSDVAHLHAAAIVCIGKGLAQLHNAGMVHGDPTTSNMILNAIPAEADAPPVMQLTLIDFGLASTSSSVEDKAVDMYVLERAFVSTHPDLEHLFESLLAAYFGAATGAADIRTKFQKVRARGRKRTAFG